MNTSNTIFKSIILSVFSFLEGIVKTVFSSLLFKKGHNLRTFFGIYSFCCYMKRKYNNQNLAGGETRQEIGQSHLSGLMVIILIGDPPLAKHSSSFQTSNNKLQQNVSLFFDNK